MDLKGGSIMFENKYLIPCKKCGKIFDSFDHDSYDGAEDCTNPYKICEDCNDEFWDKWYKLPKCKKVNGKFIRTDAHNSLIKEYFKEDYFTN